MKKLALPLSLLALGAVGLVACESGDDDQATAASQTETTVSVSRFGSKACGSAVFPGQAGGHGRFEVREGYLSVSPGAERVDGLPPRPRLHRGQGHDLELPRAGGQRGVHEDDRGTLPPGQARMKKLATLLSLLALGALGLTACEGGGDDQTAAASETETTASDRPNAADPAASPAAPLPNRLAVDEGDISCRGARRVMPRPCQQQAPGYPGVAPDRKARGGMCCARRNRARHQGL